MSKLCKRVAGATFVIFLLIIASLLYLNRSSQLFFKVSELDEQPLGDGQVNGKDDLPQLPKWRTSGTTSKTFTGIKRRTFPKEKVRFQFVSPTKKNKGRLEPWCQKWGVLTTIFKVSKAVHHQSFNEESSRELMSSEEYRSALRKLNNKQRQVVKLSGWCLVVVLDKHSTSTYNTGWFEGEGHTSVVVLSPSDQEKLSDPFVKLLPWNHFGRKNVGYLYAIKHGATIIWDFDDDNGLKFWLSKAAPPGAPSLDNTLQNISTADILEVRVPLKHEWPTYNPYPTLGAPFTPCWPRGLPLDDIKEPRSNSTLLATTHMKANSIGVLQSLAEYEPDVDAVYRLTMPIPFFFKRTTETRPLMVPLGVLTPYNAQATLHFQKSFFCLFLPITVTGRVTDIWRSYIAQRLFWDVDLHFGFVARPLVIQDRNTHSNSADFVSEDHIYNRAKQLIKFLGSWKGRGKSIVTRTEELWIALYERHYVELEDVKLIQLWLQSLINIGYSFPELIDRQIYSIPSYPLLYSTSITEEDGDNEFKECVWDAKQLTLWTSDYHCAARIDIPSLLAPHGHKSIVTEHKMNMRSYYPHVFEMPQVEMNHNVSKAIANYHMHFITKLTMHLPRFTEDMVIENFNFYKSNPKILTTDIFLIQYVPSGFEMWMPFNKTIAFVPAHRYNLGRCSKNEWMQLNKHLQILENEKRHIIGAASFYDQEYMNHYTGIHPLPLRSSCGQYVIDPSLYPFKPNKTEILFLNRYFDYSKSLTQVKKFKIVDLLKLYQHYTIKNLLDHRAVVYIPYSVMSYKMCEFYALGLPLFVPSVKFFRKEHNFGPDRPSTSQYYCEKPSLEELIPAHPTSTHPYSPNVDGSIDKEAECYWLQMADFYQWPHITHFDNMSDLERKLETADFGRIHRLMRAEAERKKAAIENAWCKALKNVPTDRVIPKDYNTALKKLYNTTRMLVY